MTLGSHETHAETATDGLGPTMRAVVQDRYGPADVLRVAEVDVPAIATDQVLVRVHAAGIDRGTWHLMTGRPWVARLIGGIRRPRRQVPGLDLAGVVVRVGADVTRFTPGDEVFGTGLGSLAEYAAAPESTLAPVPEGCSLTEAAVLGVSGLTALQAVHRKGTVRAGQRVLVMGASGGVGSYAVQMAHAAGATVTGVCSGAKADAVRALGADHVIDHQRDDPTAGSDRYDLIIDIGGRTRVRRLRRILAPEGTLVIVGGEGGNRITGGFGRGMRAAVRSRFTRQRMVMVISDENAEDLQRLADMVAAGTLRPWIDRTYPLDEAPEALRRLEAGLVTGKVAVEVAPAG